MFPAFPSGATPHSIALACIQAGLFSSLEQKIAHPNYKHPRPLKSYLDDPYDMARLLLRGEIDPYELSRHHTFGQLLLHRIPRFLKLSGVDSHIARLGHEHFSLPFRADSLRLCPQCADEDIAKFGCGHWRREHQLRHVAICTKHLVPLHDLCGNSNCSERFSLFARHLPGQPCSTCKNQQTSAIQLGQLSVGYVKFCNLYTDALQMRIPELEPENLDVLYELPQLLQMKLGEIFSILHAWVGEQFGQVWRVIDIAIDWLYDRPRTSAEKFTLPSLIFLAAFRRWLYETASKDERLAPH